MAHRLTLADETGLLHLGESDYFSSGEVECVITARMFNVGLAICADAGHPMHAERTVHLGAEIYINSVLSAGCYEKDAGMLESYAKQFRPGDLPQ